MDDNDGTSPPKTSPQQATPDCFKHAALDHNAPSIRLIRVCRHRSPEGYIQCEVRHTTINSTYICLSYTWGDELGWNDDVSKGHWILMDGERFWVRKNLHCFLRVARHKHRLHWLWIDALSIDQTNNTERTHQVQQMGRIFSEAKEVISWLGPNRRIAEFLSNAPQQGFDAHGFHDFCNSEYWNRAWITQEVALSRRSTLMARGEELEMNQLPLIKDEKEHSEYLSRLNDLSPRSSHRLKGKNLIYLLKKFMFKECHIARDRVFSLLALCGEGSNLQVDYKISSEELAYNILTICRQSICFCTVRVVCRALRILDRPHTDFSDPFKKRLIASITLPISQHDWPDDIEKQDPTQTSGSKQAETHPNDPPSMFTIRLGHLCDAFDSGVGRRVTFRMNSSEPLFSYQYHNSISGINEKPIYRHYGCSVQFSDDNKFATLHLSLGLLVDLLKLPNNENISCMRILGLEPKSKSLENRLQLYGTEKEK